MPARPCGHILFELDLPISSAVQPRDVRQPDAPLRVAEAALLGVSRTKMYELVASGQVPVVRLGPAELKRWITQS